MNNPKPLKKGFVNRKIFHFFVNASVATVVWFIPQDDLINVAVSVLLFIFIGEIIRLKTKARKLVDYAVGGMMKKSEKKSFTGVFWLAFGGVIVSFFAPPEAISYGFIVLSLADPAAAVIGKRFKSFQFYKRKTLIGSFAFLMVAFLVSIPYFTLIGETQGMIEKSIIISFGLTLVEIFSPPLDDNFTLLIAATLGIMYFV